jgi:hypothetical protein
MKLIPRWTGVDHTLSHPGNYDIYVEWGKYTYMVPHYIFHRGIYISLMPLDGYNAMVCFLEYLEKRGM